MTTQTETDTRVLPHEPDAHVVSRHFRTGVRMLLIFSVIATIVCLFFLREAAYLAAIPIPVLYAVLAFTNYLEVRSRASNLRSIGQTKLSREEFEVNAETIGTVTLLKVIGVLGIGAFIVAASISDWQVVGAVTTALFFLLLLIQTPFLPLYFSETERDEFEKLRRERRRSKG